MTNEINEMVDRCSVCDTTNPLERYFLQEDKVTLVCSECTSSVEEVLSEYSKDSINDDNDLKDFGFSTEVFENNNEEIIDEVEKDRANVSLWEE